MWMGMGVGLRGGSSDPKCCARDCAEGWEGVRSVRGWAGVSCAAAANRWV